MTAQLNPQRNTRDYQQLDAAHHIHALLDQKALNREGPRVMVRGEGLQLWDNDGKRYLDGMSGLWCTNLGYGRQDLAVATSCQLEQLPYYNVFFHIIRPAVVELSEMPFNLPPDHYSHAIYTNSGSEVNEVLIRTVRHYWQILGKPQEKIMIGHWNDHHGSILGSTALGGIKFMREMGGMLPDFVHINEPHRCANGDELSLVEFDRRAALQLEEEILELDVENVAAPVAKSSRGADGMIFLPQSYQSGIQHICRQYDVPLYAGEVIGGLDRIGEWFAYEHFGFQPDILSIARGLTFGYIPMGGLVLGKRITEVLVEQDGVFARGLIYSGYPAVATVAIVDLKAPRDEDVVTRVREETGSYLQRYLREVFDDHLLVGEAQGAGFVAALQFAEDKATREHFANENDLAWRCRTIGFEGGVIIRSTLGRMITTPALMVGCAETGELIDKARIAVDRTACEIGVL